MRFALLALLLAGCPFQHGAAPGASDGSAAVDAKAMIDARVIDAHLIDGSVIADAPPDMTTSSTCDPAACSAHHGACMADTCEIATTGGDVSCPSGMPCHISCNSPSACDGNVDCGTATSCTIDCIADNSCGAMFGCTGVACTLYCRGVGACSNCHIKDNGESCDLECCGSGSCTSAQATPSACSGTGTCP